MSLFMKIRSLLFIFLLICYIYSLTFTFFPFLTMKMILAVLGLFAVSFDFKGNVVRIFPKEIKKCLKIFSLLFVWSLFSYVINGGGELIHVRTFASFMASLFASYYLYSRSKSICFNIDDLLLYISHAVFIESVITILMRVYPPLFDAVYSILLVNVKEEHLQSVYNLKRLTGIGEASYFGVITSATIGIFSSIFLVARQKFNRLFLLVEYLTISIVSFFVARVCIVPIAFSLVLFLIYTKNNLRKNLTLLTIGFFVIWVLYVYMLTILPDNMYNWAFGIFMNDNTETNSVDELLSVIERDKDINLMTFIFGDCRYTDPVTYYYKATDVGYFREVFYHGIVGLYLVLWLQYTIVRSICTINQDKKIKVMLLFLFMSYLVVLIKGDILYLDILCLIFVFEYFNKVRTCSIYKKL